MLITFTAQSRAEKIECRSNQEPSSKDSKASALGSKLEWADQSPCHLHARHKSLVAIPLSFLRAYRIRQCTRARDGAQKYARMKLIRRAIDKNGEGTVKVEAYDVEDMWHIYNLITPGDVIRAPTIRKVRHESATGSTESERMRISLTIQVVDVDFDSLASALRVKGKVVSENKHVKVGAYHTTELEPLRAFSIGKKKWDSVALGRLALATNPVADADLAAVVMQEGLAHVLVVSRSLTLTRARIEVGIPRKGINAIFNREDALNKFFATILRSLRQHVMLDSVKVVLLASPGFVKDEFHKYMTLEASRNDFRDVIDNKAKFVLCHSSSGHRHALQEVLSKPELVSVLEKTSAAEEVRAMNSFFNTFNKDPERACYGTRHIRFADEMGAIDTLLMSDELFRSHQVAMRKKYVAIAESVKRKGGKLYILSSQHVTGEQLTEMTGIAAILRFPLPELDDIDMDASEEDEEDANGEKNLGAER